MAQHGDRGISIGGHANVSGQVATGDNVTQNQQIAGAAGSDVTEALARVEALLERHAAELPEAARARRDLADVHEEAQEDDPDPERMGGALARLGRRVAGVAALAEAVRALAAAVGMGG
ncbi:DUF5955 family protein [Actinomadura napierensis]|uniref:DUF4404 family protein n=1 Tax=Actinomadura napierensis TaxID=267854 RepID=A0ABN3A965_9ACTN